jgi:hypothetical protein
MTPLLRLSSFALIAICIGGTWGGVLFGFQMFRTEAIIRFVQAFAWFAICLALMRSAGVWGAVLAYDLACLLTMALLLWFGIRALRKHNLRLDFRNALQESRVFKEYSLAVMMQTAVTLGSQYAVFAMLSRSPGGAIASGRFFAAFQYSRAIGSILVEQGRLGQQDAEEIQRFATQSNIRFGDAALQLNLLTQNDIDVALAQQFRPRARRQEWRGRRSGCGVFAAKRNG